MICFDHPTINQLEQTIARVRWVFDMWILMIWRQSVWIEGSQKFGMLRFQFFQKVIVS